MMYKTYLRNTNHKFRKTNFATLQDRHGIFDAYTCDRCGISGKVRQLGVIEIPGNHAFYNVEFCKNAPIPKKIKIIKCHAVGAIFSNLEPGSIHDVIAPPSWYKEKVIKGWVVGGVWVMGVGRPVRVQFDEFETVEGGE